MNIIIAGNGKVGFTLAGHLVDEGHNITIVDTNQAALDKASNQLDVMCVKGNCASRSALLEAGAHDADMVIAATDLGIDTVILGGAPRIIVEDEALMKDLGIPAGMKPVLGICLGYATAEEPPKTHSITVNRV